MLLYVLAGAHPCAAASFARLDLTMDGAPTVDAESAAEPGDRLDLTLIIYPQDKQLEIGVRAFLVSRDDASVPIRAQRAQNRGGDGEYLQQIALESPGEENEHTIGIAIAFADLDIPAGRHLIGYVVECSSAGEPQFTAASELTFVTVGDEARQASYPVEVVTEFQEERIRTAVVLDAQNPTGFREAEFPEVVAVTVKNVEERTLDVMIPRGFQRERQRIALTVDQVDPEITAFANWQSELPAARRFVPLQNRPIYFATNRNVVRPTRQDLSRFGDDVDATVSYGSCFVNIPLESHIAGRLERPDGFFSGGYDPDKHFAVERMNLLERAAILQVIGGASDADSLLYIHGYNNPFEFAVLRLAQLQHDIRFPGPAMVFSWPSQRDGGFPSLSSYRHDERMAAQSHDALANVLQHLISVQTQTSRADGHRTHVVAHSMGNRVLLHALARIAATLQEGDKPFGHIVLAAPDIDDGTFVALVQHAARCAETLTMYFCAEDKALKVARLVYLDSRAGERHVFIPPLWNIDATNANTSLLGHDVFVSRAEVLLDIEKLFNLDLAPTRRRPPLLPASALGHQYWIFP